jgi:hypothetical protein
LVAGAWSIRFWGNAGSKRARRCLTARLARSAAFGGSSSGLPVVQDFLYGKGTAMAQPLYWLIAQIVLTVLAPRRGLWGAVGIMGLAIFGLLSGIGALGEPTRAMTGWSCSLCPRRGGKQPPFR